MSFSCLLTDYESNLEAIKAVRFQVFVDEQNIPAENEMDERDPLCIHALVLEDQTPVATGRLDLNKNGKIGRVAVLKTHRRKGLGQMIMNALETYAKKHGLFSVSLNAQESAIPFYKSINYEIFGDMFYEENIPHRKMIKNL